MKRKCVAGFLACLILLCIAPVSVFAAAEEATVVYYEDGSYDIVEIKWAAMTRTSDTVTGSKTRNHYSADNILQWKAVLKATFSYDGNSAVCTNAYTPVVTVYDDIWSVYACSASKSGAVATGYVTMALRQLLGTTKVPVTLTLTCDANGSLN